MNTAVTTPAQTPSNPLLDFADLPLFASIRPEHVEPAVKELLASASSALAQATEAAFAANWQAISKTLDVATERLSRAWGAVSHLNSVADTPELRAAYNAQLPAVTEFWTLLGSDERLYAKYKAIDAQGLNTEQKKALENALRNFRLGGAELTGSAKERFAAIQERQAALAQKFSENSLDATDNWFYVASDDEVAGIPADVLQTAREAAQAQGKTGYKLTLKMPCYLPVMQFAQSSPLRERLYRAYTTRASEVFADAGGDNKFDNGAIVAEILALRQEEAKLLGYDNFAQVSLVPKMAQSPQQVTDFLQDLARRARPYALKDLADMRAFAAQELQLAEPQPWDWSYVGSA